MKLTAFETAASQTVQALRQPFRIQLLLAIGTGEACVCHLEAYLGQRQAYISQHLMALRAAGILHTRRRGKFVYYRLADPAILDLLKLAAALGGAPAKPISERLPKEPCDCPTCQPVLHSIEPTKGVSNA